MPRKKTKINLAQLSRISELFATVTDAAYILGISRKTLHQKMNTDKGVRSAWEGGRAKIRCALRKKQLSEALNGNTAMLIFLGKNYLGQADKKETKTTISDNAQNENKTLPIDVLVSKSKAVISAIEEELGYGTGDNGVTVGQEGVTQNNGSENIEPADCCPGGSGKLDG